MSYENIDFSVDPRDDFYSFCNGKWLKENKIPLKYSKWGTFEQIFENNKKKIEEIISNCNSQNNLICNQIKNLYETGLNKEKRENQNIKYIKHFLSDIKNIKNKKNLIEIIAKFHKHDRRKFH